MASTLARIFGSYGNFGDDIQNFVHVLAKIRITDGVLSLIRASAGKMWSFYSVVPRVIGTLAIYVIVPGKYMPVQSAG